MAVTKAQINRAIEICKANGATKIILFGSALAAPENANDLDIACSGISGWDIFLLGGMIENEIKISVDLISLDENNDFLKLVNENGQVVYAA